MITLTPKVKKTTSILNVKWGGGGTYYVWPNFKTVSKNYNLLYKMYNLGIYNSPWLSFVKSILLSAGFGYV